MSELENLCVGKIEGNNSLKGSTKRSYQSLLKRFESYWRDSGAPAIVNVGMVRGFIDLRIASGLSSALDHFGAICRHLVGSEKLEGYATTQLIKFTLVY